MNFLHLILSFCMMTIYSVNPVVEYQTAVPIRHSVGNSDTGSPTEPVATNMVLQSKDGGQTWQDISAGLPVDEHLEDFFSGASAIYLRSLDDIYRRENSHETPVWEKVNDRNQKSDCIALFRSRITLYNEGGRLYQRTSPSASWLTDFYAAQCRAPIRTIFETSGGTLFGTNNNGIYRSVNGGQTWEQVRDGGGMEMAESDGMLIGTSQQGIVRSTDDGEHWETVISEGGVGIAVEPIAGGFAAIAYNTTTKSRRIHLSFDGGRNWKAIDNGLPPSPLISSIKQVGGSLICGHPDGIFRSTDLGKTWSIVHLEAASPSIFIGPNNNPKKVFKIFVSGDVLYAVARNGGC